LNTDSYKLGEWQGEWLPRTLVFRVEPTSGIGATLPLLRVWRRTGITQLAAPDHTGKVLSLPKPAFGEQPFPRAPRR
jgi:hypothetical protein